MSRFDHYNEFGSGHWREIPETSYQGPSLFTILLVSGVIIFVLFLVGR